METPQQQLHVNARPQPDGSTKLYFLLHPQSQVIGEVTIWAAAANLLPTLATSVLNWANQQAGSGMVLAWADTLGQLDKARKAVNGDH